MCEKTRVLSRGILVLDLAPYPIPTSSYAARLDSSHSRVMNKKSIVYLLIYDYIIIPISVKLASSVNLFTT